MANIVWKLMTVVARKSIQHNHIHRSMMNENRMVCALVINN